MFINSFLEESVFHYFTLANTERSYSSRGDILQVTRLMEHFWVKFCNEIQFTFDCKIYFTLFHTAQNRY